MISDNKAKTFENNLVQISMLIFIIIITACSISPKPVNSALASTTINDSHQNINPINSAKYDMEDSICCDFENGVSDLGIGVVLAPHAIELFNDSSLKNLYSVIQVDSIRFNSESPCPLYFSPDYGIMHFVCLRHTNNAYQVLVDSSVTRYLPDSMQYELEPGVNILQPLMELVGKQIFNISLFIRNPMNRLTP